jgi:hypothetical protein
MNVDELIRSEAQGDPLTAAQRELLWVEVLSAREQDAGLPRRRRLHRRARVTFAVASLLVLLVTGVATGATQRIINELFADDAPVTERVDQLRDPDGERATPEEYREIQQSNMVPAVKRIGILRDDEMKPLSTLAGIEKSRVLIDDPELGRVVAVPTADGRNWCYHFALPGRGAGGGGSCGGSFGPHGIATAWTQGSEGRGDPVQYGVHGVASDDVTRLEVELEDGSREPVLLRQNAFVWSSTEQPPVAIHVWRGELHSEERLPVTARMR